MTDKEGPVLHQNQNLNQNPNQNPNQDPNQAPNQNPPPNENPQNPYLLLILLCLTPL